MKIEIRPSERLMIMGKTGSGKTEFEKFLSRRIAMKMPVVIIDPKTFWLGEMPEWAKTRLWGKQEPGTIDRPHKVKHFNEHHWVQVLQPDVYSKNFEKCLLKIIKLKNRYVIFDETDGLCTSSMVPLGIRKVWKQGRVFRIGASAGSQTYSGIPKIFKTQAEKFVLFQVGDEDIEDAAALVHVAPEEVANLDKYEYIYYDSATMDNGLWMPPIDLEEEKRFLHARAA